MGSGSGQIRFMAIPTTAQDVCPDSSVNQVVDRLYTIAKFRTSSWFTGFKTWGVTAEAEALLLC